MVSDRVQRAQHGLHVAAHEDDRHEHDNRGIGAGEYGKHHLFGTPRNQVLQVLPFLPVMALDVFYHHDGIVQQHAYGKDYPGEGHHVELEAEEPHDREGNQDR